MAMQFLKPIADGLIKTNESLSKFKDLTSKLKEASENASPLKEKVKENNDLDSLKGIEKTDDNKESLDALKDSSDKIENLEEKIDEGAIKVDDAPALVEVVSDLIDNLTAIFNNIKDATKGYTDTGNDILGMVGNLLERALDVKEKLESLTGAANSNFDLTDPDSDGDDFDMDGDGE